LPRRDKPWLEPGHPASDWLRGTITVPIWVIALK